MLTMSYGNTFTMRFESNTDLKRERVAIEKFVSRFGGTFKKLGPNDVDYRVYDKSGELIAYAEVKMISQIGKLLSGKFPEDNIEMQGAAMKKKAN
jgi:hypothetical protein